MIHKTNETAMHLQQIHTPWTQVHRENRLATGRSLVRIFQQYLERRKQINHCCKDISRLQQTSDHLLEDIGLVPGGVPHNASCDWAEFDQGSANTTYGESSLEQPLLFDRPSVF